MKTKKHTGYVAVVTNTGKQLMPATNRRARQLLDSGRAVIYRYRPVFTIQLLYRSDGEVQPVELKMDTGYQDIGVSVCSGKHEYLGREYALLKDETERHNGQRKYRRTRRNRKRHRQPRFDNRKGTVCLDGFAPSVRNKRDRHVDLVKGICEVFPVTDAYIEMGQFDTQALKAIAEGRPLPQGTGYQQGERYRTATLREAVFNRDGYTCICCGRNAQSDGAILHVHHIGFWKGDRTDRMANLATVCEKCHTAKNHKPGGKLHGMQPKLKAFKGATFMTSVRFSMFRLMQEACPGVQFHMTYGAATKLARQELGVRKSHAGDAYAMGTMHPKHRAHTQYYQKRRRNNRILEKFRDAVFIDLRDGSKKKGPQIGCNRTKRSMPRDNTQNERMCRQTKVSAGKRIIRTFRHFLQPGDIVRYQGRKRVVKGSKNLGKAVALANGRNPSANSVTLVTHAGGWMHVETG